MGRAQIWDGTQWVSMTGGAGEDSGGGTPDDDYLRLDGSNNPAGVNEFLRQSAGDLRYLQLTGGELSGDVVMRKSSGIITMVAPAGLNGYQILASVSDTADFGLHFRDADGDTLFALRANASALLYQNLDMQGNQLLNADIPGLLAASGAVTDTSITLPVSTSGQVLSVTLTVPKAGVPYVVDASAMMRAIMPTNTRMDCHILIDGSSGLYADILNSALSLASHTHSVAGKAHTHTGPSHDHASANHNHSSASHNHSSASHNHTLNNHRHDGGGLPSPLSSTNTTPGSTGSTTPNSTGSTTPNRTGDAGTGASGSTTPGSVTSGSATPAIGRNDASHTLSPTHLRTVTPTGTSIVVALQARSTLGTPKSVQGQLIAKAFRA